MKRLFALCIILTMTLALNGLVGADITWTSVTNNPYEDTSPQIKGNYLVWQGYVDGDWEIFLYNITTGETKQITENNYNDMSPQTDGNSVVWQGYNRTGGEIFLYRIGDPTPITSDENAITNDTNIDCSPQIANGRVVWTSHQVTDSVQPGEIILYEIATPTPTPLSASVDQDGTLDDSFPRINDTEVIWVQTNEEGYSTLFIHDFAGTPRPAPEGYIWPDSPQSDGSLSVFARHDGHDREIFVHNSNLGSSEQVTNNDIEDIYPRISRNHIAWMAAGEIFLTEYKHLALISPGNGAVLPRKPPPTFTWDGIGYNKFKIQFCNNPNFPKRKTLTLPLRKKKWLSDTSFTPNGWQWRLIRRKARRNGYIYWRVKGKDKEGNKALSEVRSFSIKSAEHTVPRPR